MPKPLQISMNTLPILPVPTTPTVFPCKSNPHKRFRLKLKSRVRIYALCVRRTEVKSIAIACSATAYGEYAGTRITVSLPFACFKSTLLKPAQRSATTGIFNSLSLSMTGAPRSSFTKTQTPSQPLARSAVSSESFVSKYLNLNLYFSAQFSKDGLSYSFASKKAIFFIKISLKNMIFAVFFAYFLRFFIVNIPVFRLFYTLFHTFLSIIYMYFRNLFLY